MPIYQPASTAALLVSPGGPRYLSAPVRTAAATAGAFAGPVPSAVPGLSGWWDAGSPTSLVGSGGLLLSDFGPGVTAAADKSGGGTPLAVYRASSAGSVTAVSAPRVAALLGGLGSSTVSPPNIPAGGYYLPVMDPDSGLQLATSQMGSGTAWTRYIVWTRPNLRQGYGLQGPAALLTSGSIVVLAMDSTASPSRLVLFPGATQTVLTSGLERRHTHAVILRNTPGIGVDVWLDGVKVASGAPNPLGASVAAPLLLLHSGASQGAAQCWFHEAATWERALTSGEISTLLSCEARWPCGPRKGVSLVVVGQSNAGNGLNDGAWHAMAQGIAWHLGAAAWNVVGSYGSAGSATCIGGHGIYGNPVGGLGGDFVHDPGDGSNPSGWMLGLDGTGVEAFLSGDVADWPDIAAVLFPWSETDSVRPYSASSTFNAAARRLIQLLRSGLGRSAAQLPVLWWNAIPFPYGNTAGMQSMREQVASIAADPTQNVVIAMPQTSDSNNRGATWSPATGVQTGGDSSHRDAPDNIAFGQRGAAVAARAILAAGGGDTISAIPSGLTAIGGPRIVNASLSGAVVTITVQHDAGADLIVPLLAASGQGWTVMDGGSVASPGNLIAATACARTSPTTLMITLASAPASVPSRCLLFYPYGYAQIGRGNAVTDNCASLPRPPGWDIGHDLGSSWTFNWPLAATTTPVNLAGIAASPGQPSGMTLAGATSSSLTFAWTAPSSGGAVVSYSIQAAPSAAGPWTTVSAGITGLSFTLTGLTAATGAYYEVYAVGPGGAGVASSAVSAATTAAAGSGYAPGLYFPSTIWMNSGTSFTPLGQGFVRGLSGIPTFSIAPSGSTTAAQAAYFGIGSGCTLYWIPYHNNDPAAEFDLTLSVTDGSTTFTKAVRVINSYPTSAYTYPVVLSSNVCWTTTGAGFDQANPALRVFSFVPTNGPAPVVGGSGTPGSISLTDSHGYFQFTPTQYAHYGFETTPLSNSNLPSLIGEYPVTINSDSGVVQNTSFWIAQDQPAIIVPTFNTIWDWQYQLETNPQTTGLQNDLSLLGHIGLYLDTVAAYTPAAIQQITSSDGTVAYSYADGGLRAIGPQTAGTHSLTFQATAAITGTVTTKTISYTVQHGNMLPGSNMTVAPVAGLTNDMRNVTVATLTLAAGALTGTPIWAFTVLADEPQQLTAYNAPNPAIPTPRYTLTPAAAGQSATLTASNLSAQTDTVLVQASDAAGNCVRLTVLIAPSDKAASAATLNVGPGQTYASYNAMLDDFYRVPYAAAKIVLYPQDYSADFHHNLPGSGTLTASCPGPALVMGSGGSGAARTVVDFKGNEPAHRCGLELAGFDSTVKYLDLRNVHGGDYNSAILRKIAQSAGNISIQDCAVSGGNNGIVEGDYGIHFDIQRTWVAHCGHGEGLTHNLYIDTCSSLTVDGLLSWGCQVGHALKSRANRGVIKNSVIADGENGASSGVVDFPEGGDYQIINTVLQKGPNPSNQPNLINYMEEINNIAGPLQMARKATNHLLLDGVTFINTALGDGGPANLAVFAVNLSGDGALLDELSFLTGAIPQVTYRNCKFYNIQKSHWFSTSLSTPLANVLTDGGNNVAITTWPGLLATDPSTNALISNPPDPFGKYNPDQGGKIMTSALNLALVVPAGAAAGTLVDTAFVSSYAYPNGIPGVTWSITDARLVTVSGDQTGASAAGVFAINSSTGAITVAGTVQNGLYFIKLAAYGRSEWRFIVGGNGFVAAA